MFTQDPTASEWQRQDLNPAALVPAPIFLTPVFIVSIKMTQKELGCQTQKVFMHADFPSAATYGFGQIT